MHLLFTVALFLPLSYEPAVNCTVPQIFRATIKFNNKAILPLENISPGGIIEVDCEAGFTIQRGGNTGVCLFDGSWTISNGNLIKNTFGYCRRDRTNDNECGVASRRAPRIMGGTIVRPAELPWIVKLDVHVHGSVKPVSCVGSLISRFWILTAAHCVNDADVGKIEVVILYFGKINASDSYEYTSQVRAAQTYQIFKHSNYSNVAFDYDVALIRLTNPVVLNQYVRKICLPDEPSGRCTRGLSKRKRNSTPQNNGFFPHTLDGCSSAMAAGWGQNKGIQPNLLLRKINLTIYNETSCQPNSHPTKLCVGSDIDKTDTCQGDSGGPLMCQRRGRFHVIGIVSHGYSCGNPNVPGTNTRVCSILPWIRKTMQQMDSSSSFPNQTASTGCPTRAPNVTHGGVIGSGSEEGAIRRVECNNGYVISGLNAVFCLNSHWSKPGTCRPSLCPRNSPRVENGHFQGRSRQPGTGRRLVCDEGFRVEGKNKTVCTNLQWTGHGKCVSDRQATTTVVHSDPSTTPAENSERNRKRRCYSNPANVRNGRIEGSGTALGSSREIKCNRGYFISGSSKIYCIFGHWTEAGTCQVSRDVNCSNTTKPAIPNGFLRLDNATGINHIVCSAGFKLSGANIIFCHNGKWSDPGSCNANKTTATTTMTTATTTTTTRRIDISKTRCPRRLPTVDNGRFVGSGRRSGAIRHLKCDQGFEVEGRAVTVCENKQWTGHGHCVEKPTTTAATPSSTTKRLRCRQSRPSVENGMLERISRTPPGRLVVACNTGYILLGGNKVITCTNGIWTRPGKCVRGNKTSTTTTTTTTTTMRKAITTQIQEQPNCPEEGPEVANGFTRRTRRRPGKLRVKCNGGFKLSGRRFLNCQSDGEWSEPGQCLPDNAPPASSRTDSCQNEPVIPNAGRIYKAHQNKPNERRFQCDDGFELDGENLISCDNGQWSVAGSCLGIGDYGDFYYVDPDK